MILWYSKQSKNKGKITALYKLSVKLAIHNTIQISYVPAGSYKLYLKKQFNSQMVEQEPSV